MNRQYNNVNNGQKRKASGFTMVELIVVVALVGILTAVAVPMLFNRLHDRGVKDAAEELFEDLQRAKLLAIERTTNVIVSIDVPGDNQYTVSTVATSSNFYKEVDLRDHGPSISFTDTPQVSNAQIVFTPQGVCSTPGVFVLTDSEGAEAEGTTYRIRASGAGGISKHRYDGGSWHRQ